MNRRQFLEALSLSSLGFMALPSLVRADEEDIASALFPVPTNTGISGTIVIVGGGMAGATLAKYLRLWGGTGVKVTLIEKGDRLGGTPGADADQDGMSNWDEYVAGSDPSDRWSRFMAGPVKSTGTSTPLVVECEGVAGRRYQLWQRPTLEGAGTWTALGAPVSCSQSGPVQIPVPAAATTNRSFFCVSVSL